MKTAYQLILVLSATAFPAFAEVIATDSMEVANTIPVTSAVPTPTPNVLPVYAQNDALLTRAINSGDAEIRKMIDAQLRLNGGVQNLRNALFRKNLAARLNLLATHQRPAKILPMPSDATTEAESSGLRSEISRLRSQLSQLEAAMNRMQTRSNITSSPQVAPIMPNINTDTSSSLMLMSMLASMQSQFSGGPLTGNYQQNPFMNAPTQFYPQNNWNGFGRTTFFARPVQTTYLPWKITQVPSALPYRL